MLIFSRINIALCSVSTCYRILKYVRLTKKWYLQLSTMTSTSEIMSAEKILQLIAEFVAELANRITAAWMSSVLAACRFSDTTTPSSFVNSSGFCSGSDCSAAITKRGRSTSIIKYGIKVRCTLIDSQIYSKRLQRLQGFNNPVYYFVNVYYISETHTNCRKSFVVWSWDWLSKT